MPPELPRPRLVGTSSRPLTARQAVILDYVRTFIAKNGYPPTLRELARGCGIKSTNGVTDHLKALRRKGFLDIDHEKARGIVLLNATTGVPATVVATSDGLSAEVVRLRALARRAQDVLAKLGAIALEVDGVLEEINAEISLRGDR